LNNNIEYYNIHANDFYNGTVNVDMSLWRDKFEKYVPDGGRILDAGCGSGRDSRAFKQHGYSILAIDASKEMCRMASELIGEEVWQMRFDEISFDEEFHGIWACASLLHVPMEDIPVVLNKLHKSLVSQGMLYVSFKYGNGNMTKGERVFTNFTEDTIVPVLESAGFEIIERGITSDARPGRSEEKWINVIARKNK